MPLGALEGLGVLLGGSGGLVAAKFVKCPKSYYTEQFEKYGYIRDKYDTTYNTPTPYDPSLLCLNECIVNVAMSEPFAVRRMRNNTQPHQTLADNP